VSAKYSAELVTSFAESHVAEAWLAATRKQRRREGQDPGGTFLESKEPKVSPFSPRKGAAALIGSELAQMKPVLSLEGVSDVRPRIFAKKYFRLKLASGQIAGIVTSSEEAADRRQDYLVRVSSHMLRTTGRGRGQERVPVNVYGAVHHYAVIFVAGVFKDFAYIECVRSTADRTGAYGLPEKRGDTECFSSLGGTMRYVHVMSVDAVVGTLYVRGKHVFLSTREVFSCASMSECCSTLSLVLTPPPLSWLLSCLGWRMIGQEKRVVGEITPRGWCSVTVESIEKEYHFYFIVVLRAGVQFLGRQAASCYSGARLRHRPTSSPTVSPSVACPLAVQFYWRF